MGTEYIFHISRDPLALTEEESKISEEVGVVAEDDGIWLGFSHCMDDFSDPESRLPFRVKIECISGKWHILVWNKAYRIDPVVLELEAIPPDHDEAE